MSDWHDRIQAAIEQGGPRVVFQPIVHLWTEIAVGYEALARFDDPDYTAEDYFTHAHETGQHEELELLTAQRAIEVFFGSGVTRPPGYLSVNACHTVVLNIGSWDGFAKLPLASFQVEITEHLPIRNYETVLQMLRPSRRRGMRLAIDDVGAGYAAMRHVMYLDPDVIKLDRSLINGMTDMTAITQRALLSAITSFASAAQLDVVAEGVETKEQAAALRTLGVQFAQGYLFDHPMSFEELIKQ